MNTKTLTHMRDIIKEAQRQLALLDPSATPNWNGSIKTNIGALLNAASESLWIDEAWEKYKTCAPDPELLATRLISAAPELLEALKALVNGEITLSNKSSALYSKGDFKGYLSEHCQKVIAARAAIAKATGDA